LADLPSLPHLGHDLPLIAVDVGNNRTKFGLFCLESLRRLAPQELPEPQRTLCVSGPETDWQSLREWLGEDDSDDDGQECLSSAGDRQECLSSPGLDRAQWWIGSVNRPSATRLIDWLRTHRPGDSVTLLAAGDLPLEVAVDRPDMVGIDRLLDALAANRLRQPRRPVVVVDVGTAITVDLLSPEGVFLGGSILPGIGMGARALHEFTDMLPLLDVAEIAGPPPALGTATTEAMQSGLFWGAIGAIRQLIAALTRTLSHKVAQPPSAVPTSRHSRGRLCHGKAGIESGSVAGEPEVFLTGGAGIAVADLLGHRARHVPHLTLAGIALAGVVAIR
jgi:type III pantothenate kinase